MQKRGGNNSWLACLQAHPVQLNSFHLDFTLHWLALAGLQLVAAFANHLFKENELFQADIFMKTNIKKTQLPSFLGPSRNQSSHTLREHGSKGVFCIQQELLQPKLWNNLSITVVHQIKGQDARSMTSMNSPRSFAKCISCCPSSQPWLNVM